MKVLCSKCGAVCEAERGRPAICGKCKDPRKQQPDANRQQPPQPNRVRKPI